MTIPANALTDDQRLILGEQPGDRVGIVVDTAVRFETGTSATLVIDISHCDSTALEEREWWVWRMSPRGPSQKLTTQMGDTRAIVQIDSTSGFMIAN